VAAVETPEGRRPVGQRAGIDLARVIEAARSLDAESLTVQAVATKLGVDRKAIRHHVSDRETLQKLVALSEFSEFSSAAAIPADSSWQEACQIFGTAVADSVIAVAARAAHLQLDSSLLSQIVGPTDAILKKFTAAGLDHEAAVRALGILINICMAWARDALVASRLGERPRRIYAREALNGLDPAEFENFARLVEFPVDTYDRQQLELGIQVFVGGIEAVFLSHQ
jgi:TetR/AcrR family tetracycline transcriptional repressor